MQCIKNWFFVDKLIGRAYNHAIKRKERPVLMRTGRHSFMMMAMHMCSMCMMMCAQNSASTD